jgi:hypothetical protein
MDTTWRSCYHQYRLYKTISYKSWDHRLWGISGTENEELKHCISVMGTCWIPTKILHSPFAVDTNSNLLCRIDVHIQDYQVLKEVLRSWTYYSIYCSNLDFYQQEKHLPRVHSLISFDRTQYLSYSSVSSHYWTINSGTCQCSTWNDVVWLLLDQNHSLEVLSTHLLFPFAFSLYFLLCKQRMLPIRKMNAKEC